MELVCFLCKDPEIAYKNGYPPDIMFGFCRKHAFRAKGKIRSKNPRLKKQNLMRAWKWANEKAGIRLH